MRWWAQEQCYLVETLTDRLVVAPPCNPRERFGEATWFKMTKMTTEDDPEVYLYTFERMAVMAGWSWYQWTTILALYLTGPIQMTVDTLPITEARD